MMDSYINEERISGNCCGRPMVYAPENKCKFNDSCLSETCGCALGCIKKGADRCLAKAVIPAMTVETVDGITNLANSFVHVTNINTTFYIDDKHRPMIIWAGPIEIQKPADITVEEFKNLILENSLGLKSQHIYYRDRDTETNTDLIIGFYYDKNGKPYSTGVYEAISEEG